MEASPQDVLDAVTKVTTVFESLRVRHAIGGSYASSLHGVPRATLDVDVVAMLRPKSGQRLAAALGDGFYADADAIDDAIVHASSFNLIDLASMVKVDVFCGGGQPFDRAQVDRAVLVSVGAGTSVPLMVCSPEDTVLAKLRWYRQTGETSDRQWTDVLGVLKVQRERLDNAYLDQWAAELGVADLLARVREEAF